MRTYKILPDIIVEELSTQVLEQFDLAGDVLVVSSKTVWKEFNLQEVFDNLPKNINCHIFKNIRPNAPFSDLDFIINKLDGIRPSKIIAIGGGSVVDACKTLSVSFEGVHFSDLFYKRKEMPQNKIPLIAIPSTAGTGAELSFGAIIFDDVDKVKGGVRGNIIQPNAIILDARFHNLCPLKLKAEVGFDCLTHAVETYLSKKSNALVRYQSVACIKTIFDYLPTACNENNMKAMEKVAVASALMGINLAYSSTCLPHRIQYVIGPLTDTSHAQGLIALYKGWLKNMLTEEKGPIDELAFDLGMDRDFFMEKVQELKEQLNIDYDLADLGVDKSQVEYIANSVKGNVALDPYYKDLDTIKNILKLSFR